MKEIWLPIQNTNNEYFVSNYGNVKHFDRISKQTVNGRGYLCVGIFQKTKNVHRLVAETFKKLPDFTNLVVNHIDGNKLNNRLDNLEWCTQRYNILHSKLLNRHYIFSDDDRNKSRENRLNSLRKKVMCIETKEVFCSVSDAAKSKNVQIANICKCCKAKLNSTGGFHWKYAI